MKTVLVADDDADFRRFLRITFERGGFRVVEATDGTEALAKLREERPSVLVMDYDLGGPPDGAQVVAAVRGQPGLEDLPIVFVSAALPSRQADVQAVLNKPVDPAELVDTVEAVLTTSAA